MPGFVPVDPDFEARIRLSFSRQTLMTTLGATIERVHPGEVDIHLPITPGITQQHGYVHAGAMASIADSSCGYAAATLTPADTNVLAVEFKINLMAPATGDKLIARGRVIRAGRTLTVCQSDIVSVGASGEKLVAILTATIMNVKDRPEPES
jgi:uncharacterized protein (TIGR00369 family)